MPLVTTTCPELADTTLHAAPAMVTATSEAATPFGMSSTTMVSRVPPAVLPRTGETERTVGVDEQSPPHFELAAPVAHVAALEARRVHRRRHSLE